MTALAWFLGLFLAGIFGNGGYWIYIAASVFIAVLL